MRTMPLILLAAVGLSGVSGASLAEETAGGASLKSIKLPVVDSGVGQQLFVTKGCVMCHAVNGVGGTAAPSLDASSKIDTLDLMTFVARMWRGASAMTALQSIELGYVIDLEGEDIAHIAAFSADPVRQKGFSDADVPELMRDSLIHEPYWEGDDWPDVLNHGIGAR